MGYAGLRYTRRTQSVSMTFASTDLGECDFR